MDFFIVILVIAIVIIMCSLYHGYIHQNSITKYDILQEKHVEIQNRIQSQLQEMHNKQNTTINELKDHRDETSRKFDEHHSNTIQYLNQQQEIHSDKLQDINDNVNNVSDSVNEQVQDLGLQRCDNNPDIIEKAHNLSSIMEVNRSNMINVQTEPNSYDFMEHEKVELEDNRVYGSNIQPYQGNCKYPYYFGSHNDYRPFVKKDLDVIEGFSNYEDEPKGILDATPDDDSIGDSSSKVNYNYKKINKHLNDAVSSHNETKNHLNKAVAQHKEMGEQLKTHIRNSSTKQDSSRDTRDVSPQTRRPIRNVLNLNRDDEGDSREETRGRHSSFDEYAKRRSRRDFDEDSDPHPETSSSRNTKKDLLDRIKSNRNERSYES